MPLTRMTRAERSMNIANAEECGCENMRSTKVRIPVKWV